ncbi:hypothetical protein TD95_003094 [Thielaviopsis punctulata]|uniref:Restriction endonuclease type IV Mrr domain-containing protein n=1 Tax=Thielaviopsis punctulata TaxID=72032 RepID=A0A0F4ZHW2_9PEZI|nr:hypothetical protein TD95_003094 [Thielaviopsis punctulata]
MLLRRLRRPTTPLQLAKQITSGPQIHRLYSSNTSADLVYPDSNTTAHRDMRSFLHYASRSGLDPKSTVFVGTYYEYLVGDTLARYGFHLRRIGGASDGGIDLLGEWTPPSTKEPIRVLVQCKGGKQNTGPRLIRELEGAFVSAPVGWRGDRVLGIFTSENTATKGMRDAMARSKWPMATITCTSNNGGSLYQFLWNRAADNIGLNGLGVDIKRSPANDTEVLVLTWEGKPLPLKPAIVSDA